MRWRLRVREEEGQISSIASLRRKHPALPIAMGAIAVVLAIASVALGYESHRQAAQIAAMGVQLSDLQNNADALKEDVRRLTDERQSLLKDRDAVQSQLAEAQAQREQLRTERDQAQAQLSQARTALSEVRAERDRLEAEQTAARVRIVPTPAPFSAIDDAKKAAIAKVLDLDDQIDAEFTTFMGYTNSVVSGFYGGDLLGAQANFGRASQSADRLKALMAERKKAAEALR